MCFEETVSCLRLSIFTVWVRHSFHPHASQGQMKAAGCSAQGQMFSGGEMLRWLSSHPTRGSHVKPPGGISLGCYRKLEIEPSVAACGALRGMQGCLWGYDLRHPLFPARGAEIMGKVTEHPTVCATVSHCLKFLSLSSSERLLKTSGGECFYPPWETK